MKETIDYYEDHEEGDEGLITALNAPRKDVNEYHQVRLYDTPASISDMLKWGCKRCKKYYADPKLFEEEPCIPYGDS